jgi:hypothetical protein
LDSIKNSWILKSSSFDLSKDVLSRRNDIVKECSVFKRQLEIDEEFLLKGIVYIVADFTSTIIGIDEYEEANDMLSG